MGRHASRTLCSCGVAVTIERIEIRRNSVRSLIPGPYPCDKGLAMRRNGLERKLRWRVLGDAVPLRVWLAAIFFSVGAVACHSTPKVFPIPGPSEWKPEGCRPVSRSESGIEGRGIWRNLHTDSRNSDEVSVVLSPEFSPGWVAESSMWNASGVVFDRFSNVYFTPLFPHENVVLIGLDGKTGNRLWAIPGKGNRVGAGSPMVLDDPDRPGEEIIYLGLQDRALAVRTSGEVVWDVPTGLSRTPSNSMSVFGVNYSARADALVAVAADGSIYVLDRKTGRKLLSAPQALPGAPGVARTLAAELTPELSAKVAAIVSPFLNLPPGLEFEDVLHIIFGEGVVVANFFAIDSDTGAMYFAATAPDEADGVVDGVAATGALYRMDLVHDDGKIALRETCRKTFRGGSASTPALRADGERVYVADAEGRVLALNSSCEQLWEVDTGEQVHGSIAVSSDKGELYASSSRAITKIVDRGDRGELIWQTRPDAYDLGPLQETINVQMLTVAANGIAFQGGAGVSREGARVPFPLRTGMGLLDRDTGEVLYFSDGPDEAVSVVSIGPDGMMVIGDTPFRRAFVRAIRPSMTEPLSGGVHKWTTARPDLIVRDAVCAAESRLANARANETLCPESSRDEEFLVQQLLAQAALHADHGVMASSIARLQKAPEVSGLANLCARLAESGSGGPA